MYINASKRLDIFITEENHMGKRILSFTLATIMILGALSLSIQPAFATSDMKLSDEGIAYLKRWEGFSRTPYWDYGQWTVGYGFACPKDKLEEYKENGIPNDEAEELLKNYIASFESYVNKFIKVHSLNLSQNQFDMLVCFSYNVGPLWMFRSSSPLQQAILKGCNDSTFVRELVLWSKAGDDTLKGLVERRVCDANMYLNGDYTTRKPQTIGYVYYSPNGGYVKYPVQGFVVKESPAPVEIPTYEGHTFIGWYTEQVGGKKVEALTKDLIGATLYAHWDVSEGIEPAPIEPIKVKVIGDAVNLREGPGTNYKIIGQVNKEDILTITKKRDGSGYTWGKSEKGWICMKYISSNEKPSDDSNILPDSNTADPTGRSGVVNVTGSLRVRKGAGMTYPTIDYLFNGTKVKILETASSDNMTWGRIGYNRWISLNYVVLDEKDTSTSLNPSDNEENNKDKTPIAETVTGTVNVDTCLTIRKTYGLSGGIVGYYHKNDKVSITELAFADSMTWGKTDKGWISMRYVNLNNKCTITADRLNIRQDAGTNNPIVGYLYQNENVIITEIKLINNIPWGKISEGWVCMTYVKF
jgi:uncharacterized repeat protein (TIGR02543 family)